MSMKIKPLSADYLIAIFDIIILLEKYIDTDGQLVTVDSDAETGESQLPESELDFACSLHRRILSGELSIDSSIGQGSNNDDLLSLLTLFYLKKLDVVCDLNCTNKIEDLNKMYWIHEMQASENTPNEITTAITELLTKGYTQVSLLKGWTFITKLFEQKDKEREIELEHFIDVDYETGAIDRVKYAKLFYGRFVTINFLDSRVSRKKIHNYLYAFIKSYIAHFIHQNVDWGKSNVFKWEKQKKMIMSKLVGPTEDYGQEFWLYLDINKTSYSGFAFKKYEALIALAIEQIIQIKEFEIQFVHGKKVLAVKVQVLEFAKNQVLQDVEASDVKLDDPILIVHLDDYGRVYINQQLVATPVSGGDVDVLMSKLLKEKKTELNIKDISEIKAKGKRTIAKIITDLGFRGAVRQLFFPSISDKKLVFRCKIYRKDLENAKITEQHVLDELSQSKKVKVSRKKSK